MAQKPAPGPAVDDLNKRSYFFVGLLVKPTRKADGTKDTTPRPFLGSCRAEIQDLLNLPKPTPAQTTVVKNGKKIRYQGARMAKTVRVPHPTGAKTPKGATRMLSLQFPTNVTVDEIDACLKATGKVKFFTIAGGRSYAVSA